jgi:hypothetical protein
MTKPHPENRPRSRRPRLHPRPCHGLGRERECKWLHQGHALRSRLRGQRCEYADLPAPAQPRRRASADHGADAPADIEREPLRPLLIPLDASGKRVLGSNGPELALGCRQCPRAGSPSGTGPLFDGPQFTSRFHRLRPWPRSIFCWRCWSSSAAPRRPVSSCVRLRSIPLRKPTSRTRTLPFVSLHAH